ncbi:hypothetical protein AIOL_002463 [Candidatus Rhodobacter oscarellae]|uniref:Uncharacterized protein n=1 Tax=Candidatus Rhodobacter oscarellae TaxID=1675527 RepID=A0A0J9GV97_9RHOB|nr:hypothetical protein AIOL_002463 [Candidatus Rhodobacter lobularis]
MAGHFGLPFRGCLACVLAQRSGGVHRGRRRSSKASVCCAKWLIFAPVLRYAL